jgi:prepilin-type N-terminal cleavage/methylation domain-containing protein
MMNRSAASREGFSLTELSVVLTIIALVVGLSLSAIKIQLDIAKIEGTQQHLQLVRSALSLYHKKYNRYPCPAVPSMTSADANYGLAAPSCDAACPAGLACDNNAVIGFVPFKTIKLNEELAYDAWDHKITYAIDKTHTVISKYENGSIPIIDASGNKITASPVFDDSIFVLVSHGNDGKGGYDDQGNLTACGATALDVENCDGDSAFRDTRLNDGDREDKFFDDLVLWQTQETVSDKSAVISIAQGHNFGCALKQNGTVWCWGDNGWDQLADGTQVDSNLPVQIANLSGTFTQITAGDFHACTLRDDGTVWCWGINEEAQLGRGTLSVSEATPAQPAGSLTGVIQVEAGDQNTCAVKNDGTLWCWGINQYGEAGRGTTGGRQTTPGQISQATGLTNVTSVHVKDNVVCALKNDGTVWCWGYGNDGATGDGTSNTYNQPNQVTGLTDITYFQGNGGESTFCAVKNDGTAWCWGANWEGQAGNGTIGTAAPAPVQVSQATGLTNAQQIAVGEKNVCVIKNDGTLWCWGDGSGGMIGDGGTSDQLTAVQVPMLTNVKQVDVDDISACALKNNGSVWCWGSNTEGQLGMGVTGAQQNAPVQVQNLY